METTKYTLGSLFDGSGGFPLAGSLCGIEPKWAAEVEPYPIAVTRSRFPNMKHLGDISKVSGADIHPVHIITFGSPCQDLSVAGKRAGLKHEANGDEETTRSGLFMEAVRIIKEMREATNGLYPTFALWENVPGAFSSNKGEDFRTVLEELIRIVEPGAVMPPVPKAGWAYADSYSGDGWSLAYRVFDAQYWGVPQRRRRIHLVVDFRGQRAQEILFKRQGVRGYFAEGRTPWKGIASHPQGSVGADDREGTGFDGYNADITGDVSSTLGVNCGMTTGRNGVIIRVELGSVTEPTPIFNEAYQHHGWRETDISGTLTAGQNGTVRGDTPLVAVPYTLKIRSGCEGGGKGALVQEDKSATLATNNDQYLFQPVQGVLLDDQGGQQINVRTDDKSPTLRAETHGNLPCVVEKQPVFCLQGSMIGRADKNGPQGDGVNEDVAFTCNTIDRHAVAFQTYQKVSGPLMANSHPGSYTGQDAFNDMLVAGANPIAIDRAFFNQGQNAKYAPQYYDDGTNPTLVAKGPSGVAYGCNFRNNTEYEEQRGTMQAKGNVGFSYNCNQVVRCGYIVRRLTPTECARLQGFPDCWGNIDEKTDFTDDEYRFWLDVRNTHAAINGKAVKEYTKAQMLTWYNKLHTDSAEYKMWGNGIALPPALYCMQGMADALKKERRTMVVYIAGKMTGLEDKGRGNFAEAEKEFKERGFTVLNPAVLPDGMPGERYMPICFAMIDQADMVILLNNWKDSPGATLEREYAKYQKKMVFEYDEVKGWECW